MEMAALLVIAYVLSMFALTHADSTSVFEPGLLLPVLNTVFAGLLPIFIAVLAMRVYYVNGMVRYLFLACGLMTFGFGAILAGWLVSGQQGPNVNVTIYNVGLLAGSLLHLFGLAFAAQNVKSGVKPVQQKRHLIAAAIFGVLFFLAVLTFSAIQGITPTFFVQGQGPTPLRQAVLGTATTLYFASALILMNRFKLSKAPFQYWYALSLCMMALGIVAILMQKSVGSPLGWLSRSGHYLAAIYALVAVITIVRNARSHGESLQTALDELFQSANLSNRVLVETVTDPIVTLDQDLCIIQWNSSAERVFGFRQDEAMGRNLFELAVRAAGADLVRETIRNMSIASGEHVNVGPPVAVAVQTKGGTIVQLEVSLSSVRDHEQMLVVCVFKVGAERKAIEDAEHQHMLTQLGESDDFLNDIADAVPSLLSYWTPDLKCAFANTAFKYWFGQTSSEITGVSIQTLLGEAQFQKFEPFIRAALAGEPQGFEHNQFNPKGENRFMWGQYVPRWKNGRVIGLLALFTDISETKKAQEDLRLSLDSLAEKNAVLERLAQESEVLQVELVTANDKLTFQNEEKGKRAVELMTARDEAESANLAKSRFLATMSHEIRTPMNAVLGMAQVLMQFNISESNRIDYARTIFNSGQTLLALLNDILDLSKIEAGKLDLESVAIAPAQLIQEAQTLFYHSAHTKGLSIEAHWSGPEQPYLGDPNRLRQMLANLVGNAIKFTKQGSIRIEASEVACTGQSATLDFAVIDSGIGIAPDKLKLLFHTFSQADSSTTREYGGSGLGLSIVRTLARAMGGDAGVESEAGVGSRFWFRVQADRIATHVPAVPSQTERSALSYAAKPAQLIGRVLVIEDNPINQEVMQVMLGQMGLEVALADDGQQALDGLMAGERAQLILTDLQMPVMDGYTAAQHIRQWEAQTQQKRRPIIALSADAFDGVRARCLAAGMDEVLSKPVLQGDLWAALAKWLPAAPLAEQSAATPALLRTVDHAAIIALVNEILPMLAQGKADALVRFKALQELVAGSKLALEMAEAGLPLKEFRFDLTRQRLRQIASKYEWRMTP